MSALTPADEQALRIIELEREVAKLSAPKEGFRAYSKRVLRALWAAVASTDAVRAEKSLGVLIVTRLLISLGAADGLVTTVQEILNHLGH